MADETESVPLAPLNDAERGELQTLRGEMSDTRGKTFNGPWTDHYYQSETKQARARELLSREDLVAAEAGDKPDLSRQDQAATADNLGFPSVNHIAQQFNLTVLGAEVARDAAAQLEDDFGEAAGEVNGVVAGLPDGLRGSMIAALGNSYTRRLGEAERSDVDQFTTTTAGKILAQKWGHDLPRRLAVALHRVDRFEQGLSDGDFQQWQFFWYSSLGAEQRAAILDRLTG